MSAAQTSGVMGLIYLKHQSLLVAWVGSLVKRVFVQSAAQLRMKPTIRIHALTVKGRVSW